MATSSRSEAEVQSVVGLDVGSTTVKLAVRDAPEGPWTIRTARHRGRPLEAVATLCGTALPARFRLRVTGSSAPLIAARCGLVPTHEVTAAMTAARTRHPEAATLIDLGGQDAKLVLFDRVTRGAHPGRPTLVMNERCAAGVGVTLDRCLRRLGISFAQARSLAYRPDLVHVLSARCGVFAETDLVNLARRGVPPEALISSLLDALVRANLTVLARGLTPRPPVLLLGGPHAHLPALADAWLHHLDALWRARGVAPGPVFAPDEALAFPALGAALEAALDRCHPPVSRAWFADRLAEPGPPSLLPLDLPFVGSRGVRVERPPWPQDDTRTPAGDRSPDGLVLGIDAGSTQTKAVLLDSGGAVRMILRRPSGDPHDDAAAIRAATREALDQEGQETPIAATVVTGYGATWMGPLVDADAEVVETLAHAASARAVAPEANVVCDLGGQDIKVLELGRDGGIVRFEVSSRCAAGIGMALESTARELGVDREAYASMAFEAQRAPWFGDGCTVFLDANRVSFQRQGFGPGEVLAGLARALPRIVFTQVVRGSPLGPPGRVVVLQGGVQHNDAAVWAQAEYIAAASPDARVIVHPWPDLAGALGAALHARSLLDAGNVPRGPTTDRRPLPLAPSPLRPIDPCGLCENRCPRAVLAPDPCDDARSVVIGHGCEAGASRDPQAGAPRRRDLDRRVPDLYSREATELFRPMPRSPSVAPPQTRLRIAVPRALAMYRAAPLLRGYLQSLGVAPRDLVFSPPTGPDLAQAGAHHGSTDPCFPAKVLLAHVHHLLERGRFEVLFVPRVTHAQTPVRHCIETASCPVVATSPALVRAAFGPLLQARGIELVDPALCLSDPVLLADQLFDAWGPRLGVTRARSDAALRAAYQEVGLLDQSLQARARAVLDATRDGRGAVLVLARPYHVDPGLCHHLGAELQTLGYPTLSIRALPRDEAWLSSLLADDLRAGRIADPFDIRDLLPECDNSGSAERLWAARVAVRHGGLGIVDVSSFKCAQDAPTAAPIADLVHAAGTPYCALHDLDETRPRTSLRLALRTFAATLRAKGLAPWT